MSDSPVTNELMYEVLKKMQGDLAVVKREVKDTRADIIALKMIMAEFVKSDARREGDFLSLEMRVERIERRLDLDLPTT